MYIPTLVRRGARRLFDRGRAKPEATRVQIQRVSEDLDLIVLPEVFPPAKCLTTKLLVRILESLDLEPGAKALDMGTGSGAAAITMARLGLQVHGVDINPFAVQCADLNRRLYGVEGQLSLFHGDLFKPLPQGRYDIIVFNPPYLDGTPKRWFEHAFYGGTDGQVLEQFLEGASQRLNLDGKIILSYSTIANTDRLNRQIENSPFKAEEIHRQDYVAEMITHLALTFR